MNVTVGGGIAGLTCALSLHAAGFEPHVYEAERKVEAVGVGTNPLPRAVRELSELGLDGELDSVALPPHEPSYHDRMGQVLREEPLGRAAVDTRVLAWCLARDDAPVAALRRYERMRLGRATVTQVNTDSSCTVRAIAADRK
ncbi:NAD(P)-binding protein [Streptomyces sp. NPDC091371]|uniref:NAD(P)-binding protein n=1 Tax=Streptomyces sp. NPDC091371 TaxID=3155303 RepID=UPI003438F5A8